MYFVRLKAASGVTYNVNPNHVHSVDETSKGDKCIVRMALTAFTVERPASAVTDELEDSLNANTLQS